MQIPTQALLLRIFIGEDDKFGGSPLYEAIIVCWPTSRLLTSIETTPFTGVRGGASGTVPSRNVMVPVGVPVTGGNGVTVAVNVTISPKGEGFAEETSTVWVLPRLTEPLLLRKFVSPL